MAISNRGAGGVSSALAMLGVAAAVHGQVTVIYVDDDAPAGGNGNAWQTAYRDLQDALAVVNSAPGSYDVRIAEGVYTPDRATGNRGASFRAGTINTSSAVTLSLAMIGGFAGLFGADPNERDPERHPTVLSGDLLGNDGPDEHSRDDNSFCVVRIYGFTGDVVLDGLVVRAGNGSGNEYSSTMAAGIDIYTTATETEDHSSATINNCLIVGNRSSNYYATGGAFVGARDVSVIRSVIRGNTATNQTILYYTTTGGLTVSGASGVALVTDCSIEGNTGDRCGGLESHRDFSVRRTRIIANTSATQAGGIWAYNGLYMDNSLIAENSAATYGGGLLVDTGICDFLNCTIARNSAHYGGGVFVDSYQTRVLNCILWDNRAVAAGAELAIDRRNAHVSVQNSLVQGGLPGLYGFWENLVWESNLDTDPLFRDPGASAPDFRLAFASPCVDAGDPLVVLDSDLDLDGLPRVVGNTKPKPLPDMGCYEHQNPGCPADFNSDGFKDPIDYNGFINAFEAGSPLADVNRDGFVDPLDYAEFIWAFEGGC